MRRVPIGRLKERRRLVAAFEAIGALRELRHRLRRVEGLPVSALQARRHPGVEAETGELVLEELDDFFLVLDVLVMKVDCARGDVAADLGDRERLLELLQFLAGKLDLVLPALPATLETRL